MKELKISSRGIIDISSRTGGFLKITLEDVHTKFIEDIPIMEIVSRVNNEKMFNAIVENDVEILHEYLRKNGYIYNKKTKDDK